MTNPFPREVAPGNDMAIIVGPIRGVDPADGVSKLYAGSTIRGYWSTTKDGEDPLGAVDSTFNQLGSTAKFVAAFEASDMDTVLGGLAEGSTVYLVLVGATNFRGVIPFVVRSARELA